MGTPRHAYFLGLYQAQSREERIIHLLVDILVRQETLEFYMSTLNDSITALTAAVQASSAQQAAFDAETTQALAQISQAIEAGDTSAASAAIDALTAQITQNTAKSQSDTAALVSALSSITVAAPTPAPAPSPTPAPTPAVTPSFSATPDASDPLTVVLADTTGESGVVNWSWVFGDGTIGNDQSVSHTFPAAGTYSVQMNIDVPPNTYSVTQDVVVEAAAAPAPAPTDGSGDGTSGQ